jgi:hypothetical protein
VVESVSLRRVEVSELLHLAPIKPGFIPRAEQGDTFDPRLGYADRLRRVLSAFNAREEQGFPSVIRIFRGIHAASWALVDGDTRLLLNVTFDGDWHDYLSALVHHVPGFLHLIWGNCIGWERVDGRPERLFRFIQAHQVKTSFFYAHHPDLNVRDVDWLKRLRTVVDQLGDAPGSRAQLYAAVESALAPRSSADALRSALADYARDASATQPGLAGKDAVAIAQRAFRGIVRKCYAPADYALAFREAFGEDDQALARATGDAAGAGPGPLDACDAQSNVVRPFEHAHCARMFFLHVPPQARLPDAAGRTQAQRWLEELTGQLDTSCVGFTPAGLRALGVSEAELAGLPDAFRQGMRARSGSATPIRSGPRACRTECSRDPPASCTCWCWWFQALRQTWAHPSSSGGSSSSGRSCASGGARRSIPPTCAAPWMPSSTRRDSGSRKQPRATGWSCSGARISTSHSWLASRSSISASATACASR